MRFVKKALKSILAFFGYIPYKISKPMVSLDTYAHLADAFEQSLYDLGRVIPHNPKRAHFLARLIGTQPAEAYHIIHALHATHKIRGAVCEFGIADGETSALMANEIVDTTRILHLFDSFAGLSAPTKEDVLKDDIFSLGSIEAYTARMAFPEEDVLSRLKSVPFPKDRFVIHKGFIEEVLKVDTTLPDAVSMAYVDFDFYEPIVAALQFLHTKTVAGSIIIVDDYDFFSTGAKTAVDEFCALTNREKQHYRCTIPDTRYGHFAILQRV